MKAAFWKSFERSHSSIPTRESVGAAVAAAAGPVVERLEDRWLMAGNAVTPAAGASGTMQNAFVAPSPQFASLSVSTSLMVFNSIATGHTGAASSRTLILTITDTGTAPLTFPAGAFSIVNDPSAPTQDASLFKIVNLASLPTSVAPGQSMQVQVNYTAKAVGHNAALLQITSNAANAPVTTIQVHGIGTSGTGGANEPSLVRILRAYNIPTIVGMGPNDSNEGTYQYPLNPDPSSQEVPMQLLQKAGNGPVTFTDLADFTSQTSPAGRFGYYDPATPGNLKELFYITKADSQTVNPSPKGATSFDPGTNAFGLYFQSPLQDNGHARVGYSQNAYNTWDSTQQQKFRFFPLENPDGSVVPNAYIMTTTEWNAPIGYDFHNIVAIVRNVKPATDAAASPVLTLNSSDFAPGTNNLLFSRIQVQPTPAFPDSQGVLHTPPNNIVHDTDVLHVSNTGDQPLVINSLKLSNNAWKLVNPPVIGTSVAPGASLDLTVQFVATVEPGHPVNQTNGPYNPNFGGVYNGTLTIGTNDVARPTQAVNLSGWWQYEDEHDMEPGLQTILNTMGGYTTQVSSTYLNEYPEPNTTPTYYGEEVISPYWTTADSTNPVSVLQLEAFHTQGNTQSFGYYPEGTRSKTTLFTASGVDGQTFFPHGVVNGVEGSTTAGGSFTLAGNFGFVADNYMYSDDAMNPAPVTNPDGTGFGSGGGHALRFYPLRDAGGKLIPNTYFVGLDYSAIPGQNFDFQDGGYIVSNIRPAHAPPAPIDTHSVPAASTAGGGVLLQWAPVPSYTAALTYNVYRGTSVSGPFTLVNSAPVSGTTYTDTAAVAGQVNYYRITAVDTNGVESAGSGTRSFAPPAAPAGLNAVGSTSGVALTWSANTEKTLAGYNVYRSLSPYGGFVQLNPAGLLASPSYSDASAPANVNSYYLVTAVDTSGNESASSTANAASQGSPNANPPAAPTALTGVASGNSVALSWTASPSANLAGYNVYGSTSVNGPFVLLNTAGPVLPSQTIYTDRAAQAGVTEYYEVVAIDTSGNVSTAATAAVNLLAPVTGLAATGSASGVSLTWTASVTAGVLGYNVYSSLSANGSFTLLNTTGPLPASQTTYADAGAQAGVTTYYQVIAVDGFGDTSAPATAHAAVPAPVPPPAVPAGLTLTAPTAGGVSLSWTANTESDLSGYNVYRSASADGPFTLLNTNGPLTSPRYVDTAASAGATWYYQVTALDTQGRVSAAATGSLALPPGPVTEVPPPAIPAGLTATGADSGIMLSWSANTEIDLVGYNVFRSLSPTDGFTLLNTSGPLKVPQYQDASAAASRVWYYQVLAIDSQGRTSAPATAAGYRAYDATPPASPPGLTALVSAGAVTLKWNANGELDLLGYQVFRAASPNGPYAQVNGGIQKGTSFVDAKAPVGVVSYYKVCAVNTSGVVSLSSRASGAAARNAIAPAAPSRLVATGQTTGIALSWGASTTADVAGYNVYRCYTPHGRYVKLNASPLASPSLLDTSSKVKVKGYYQVRAVNTSGVESTSAKVSATRPPLPKAPKPPKVKATTQHTHG